MCIKTTIGEIETQCKRPKKFLLASFHPSVYVYIYRQSGNLVDQWLVSVQLPDVMPDINKHLEQVGRKQSANQRQIDVNIEILNTR